MRLPTARQGGPAHPAWYTLRILASSREYAMPWWLLLILLFLVWILCAILGALQVAIENVRHPLADGSRRGFSAAPAIPFFPLGFWIAAILIDAIAAPWGTLSIGSLHAVFGVILLFSVMRDWRRLRTLRSTKPQPLQNTALDEHDN
jgi:hypothetical protein